MEKDRKTIRKDFRCGNEFPGEGGGVPMAPGADAQDGKLSVCMAWGIPEMAHFFMSAIACDSQSSADQRV